VNLAAAGPVAAYPVGPSLGLDEMAGQADLVCKAVVVDSKPVEDPWFDKAPGYQAVETRLTIIAIYKGKDAKEVTFRHYAPDDKAVPQFYSPQHYRLAPDRTYIVLAAATDREGVYRQLWKQHKLQEDQGVLLAADNRPHEGQSIKELYWSELSGLLKSERPGDVKYALRHMDELSGGSENLRDFEREEVLDAIKRLIQHRDAEIANLAITIMGSRNPYMSADFAPGWLATIGAGDIPGFGQWDRGKEYLGGKLYWKQLAAVADSEAPATTRALAIRALGRAGESSILPLAMRWTKDREPQVRQAAIVLLADFPSEVDPAVLEKLAVDAEPAVRIGVAQSIGFGQFKPLVPLLGRLLADADAGVSQAAAMSLLSFSLDDSRSTLAANLRHPQYRPLFVNALASQDPERYLDDLDDIVRRKLEPENWWGGRVPWGVSWDILFRYAQRQSPDALKAGKFDKVLDALEYPASGDAKGPSYYSSSEPRDLYALYLQRGLPARAAKFRAACKKTITYDIDYYFKMADENPGTYRRQ
jgi:hypothetical protein